MAQAVAFLRAINTGNRRVTNDELCSHFESMGFTSVSAYQAAGNLLFDPAGKDDLERVIEHGLVERLGYAVPSFVRIAEDVARVASARPFTADELERTAGRVQVAFLRQPPDPGLVEEVVGSAPPDDLLAVEGRELFWLPRAGISDSELRVGEVEKQIGPMTIRTLGTVTRIAHKLA